ncbi:hypothetical protein K450DRAFT_219021 [Umbelopsis ramanniana AG]|uniref:DUF1212-domain-containing protein n=1 Tax=Umbelopsis ramanniana AG TaxID=1314678 RepID=A0AAD5EIE4_UMBRA|nr:uncharacterized protein K450DRAFT_219021 [Umbelopsis ramanniana AG]KAI8584273.1 hypothetical protein K450DRAFT_219021 [Umbelopsis ramanniana AG]
MEKEQHEATHPSPVFHDFPTAVNTPTSTTSDVTFNLDATVSFPPVPRTTTVQWQEEKETQQSHAEEAFDLVSTFTQGNSNSRPKKSGGVLSNLIRLGIADRRLKATQHQQPSKKKKRPPLYKSKSSLASQSWNVLGASQGIWSSSTPLQTRSARTSLDLSEDPYTLAEQGSANYVHHLQERMQITADIADILQRQEFIIKLGKGLIRAGAPSHRIEAALDHTSRRLDVDGSYMVLPGLMMLTFGDAETHTSETKLIKCARGLDVAKLERVNHISHMVARGKMAVPEALDMLEEVRKSPPTWSTYWVLGAYVVSAATVASLFFGGSWTDFWVSGIFGLFVGLFTLVAERFPMIANVFEIFVSICVAVIARALHQWICFSAVSLSAVVIALPGYSLTSAVMELSARNIVSGSIHLIYAVMYALMLAFGLGYGSAVYDVAAHPTSTDESMYCQSDPVNPFFYFLLLPIASVSISIIFGGSIRQIPVMLCGASVAFTIYHFMSQVPSLNSEIVTSVAAFGLGMFGNLYSKILKKMSFPILIGGIIILVPGSLGVRGAINLFDGSENDNSGIFAVNMVAIGLAVTLGLFMANVVVYPNGKKRHVFLGF